MGVVKEEISPGNGVDFPKKGDYVTMLYIGTLIDGSVFDSTIKRGPFTTLIGVGRVIQGWDEAILEMSLGEKAKLKITADYAYGGRGFGDIIPANSDLIFEVELIKINNKEVCPTTTTTTTTTTAAAK